MESSDGTTTPFYVNHILPLVESSIIDGHVLFAWPSGVIGQRIGASPGGTKQSLFSVIAKCSLPQLQLYKTDLHNLDDKPLNMWVTDSAVVRNSRNF